MDEENPPPNFAKGDLVQWTNGGMMQFNPPRRLTGFSPDGQWAFVEGGLTGIAVNELTLIEKGPPVQTPAANPNTVSQAAPFAPPSATTRDFNIPLDEGGAVVMRVPFPLTSEDFDMLVQTLELWEPKLTGKPRRPKPPAQ